MADSFGQERDGDDRMRQGDKACKKTLFQWKPEWVSAALHYEAAAKHYKNAPKAKAKHVESLRKLANAQTECTSFFNAGKALQEAGEVLMGMGDTEQSCAAYEEATTKYREASSGKAAGEALLKCALALQKAGNDACDRFFQQSIEVYVEDEAQLYSREAFNNYIRYLLTGKKYDACLKVLDQQMEMAVSIDSMPIAHKAAVAKCVIYLTNEQYAEAIRYEEDLMNGDMEGWTASTCRPDLRKLIAGVEAGDQELTTKGAKDLSMQLTGELVRMVRAIKAPEDGFDIEEEAGGDDGGDADDPDGIC